MGAVWPYGQWSLGLGEAGVLIGTIWDFREKEWLSLTL